MMKTETQMDTIELNGTWYEVEVTGCLTHMILRDGAGNEHWFYNDEDGIAEMHATLG